jgi:sec-independent protein translocase protein TatA
MSTLSAILPTLGFFGIGPLGPFEMICLAILGVLIFGKRLPEVGKSLGKGIVEFKKGLAGVDEEVRRSTESDPRRIESGKEPSAEADPDTPKSAT